MRKGFRIAAAAVAAVSVFALAGCTTFKAEGLTLSFDTSSNVEVLGEFEEDHNVMEVLSLSGGENLFNITASNMSDKINSIVWKAVSEKGGNAARNVEIRYWHGPLLKLLNIITFGILAPERLSIKGEVIRISPQGASPAASPVAVTQEAIDSAVEDFTLANMQ